MKPIKLNPQKVLNCTDKPTHMQVEYAKKLSSQLGTYDYYCWDTIEREYNRSEMSDLIGDLLAQNNSCCVVVRR